MRTTTIKITEKKSGLLVIVGAGSIEVARAIARQWGADGSLEITRAVTMEQGDTVHVANWEVR